MKKASEVKTVTYHYADDVYVDIITKPLKTQVVDTILYDAYIYRENYGIKDSMYGMEADKISKAGFVKRIMEDVPEFLAIYDRKLEWLEEVPEDWYDDLDDEYENDCDCECICPVCGEKMVPVLVGTEKEIEIADGIKKRFADYVNEHFDTQYKDSVKAFLWWVDRNFNVAAYWIASEQNNTLFDMFTVLGMFEAWRRV